MSGLDIAPGMIAPLVIALGFAAGLNVYATVCALGVMGRMHWVVLPGELGMLADTWVMAASGALFAGEFVADKIPGFDLVWNALHTFVRIPLAALLAYGAGSHLSPGMQLAVTCLGAGIAAIAHGSKTAARVLVTPGPEPVSNIALSTAEDGVAIGLSWVAMHHPLAAGVSVGAVSLLCIGGMWWGMRRIRAAWGQFFDRSGSRKLSASAE